MTTITKFIKVAAVVCFTCTLALTQEKAVSGNFVVAEQPDAPLRVSIAAPGAAPNSAPIQVTNTGSVPIRGYILRVRSTERDHAYTVILMNRLILPGQSRPAGISTGLIGSGKPESPEISIDYVEFADGSKWGSDALGRSKKIAEFVKGFDAAKAKLIELLAGREGAELSKGVDVYGGFTSSEPAKTTPKCGMLFDRGYDAVVDMLRRIKGPREADAKEFARRIELEKANLRRVDCPSN